MAGKRQRFPDQLADRRPQRFWPLTVLLEVVVTAPPPPADIGDEAVRVWTSPVARTVTCPPIARRWTTGSGASASAAAVAKLVVVFAATTLENGTDAEGRPCVERNATGSTDQRTYDGAFRHPLPASDRGGWCG